jgi:SAM-dependent methyltransferase
MLARSKKFWGKNLEKIMHLNSLAKQKMKDFAQRMFLSGKGLEVSLQRAAENHLYWIHNARLKMIRTLLPPGKRILDLGGANAPLYEMGYPYQFDYMALIDLPSDDRHQEFRRELASPRAHSKVEIIYSDFSNLDFLADQSFDLVWMGQSIEHIPLKTAELVLKSSYRLLSPGGHIALDTPNRRLTQLHTTKFAHGGFIHPDHKHEFTSNELQSLIEAAGFRLNSKKGICEMPLTVKSQDFTYEDFVLGNPTSDRIDDSYILYFQGTK